MLKLISSFVIAAAIVVSCDSAKPSSHEEASIPVNAALPIIMDLTIYLEAIGQLEASFYVELRPQIGGVLDRVLVEEGAFVEKGAPLFQIDATSYSLKVEEAKAQVLVDQAEYDAAKKKLNRFQSLADKNLVAQIEWDAMETQVATSNATLAASSAKLRAAFCDLDRCTISAPEKGRIGRINISPGALITQEQLLTTILDDNPIMVNFDITEKEYSSLPKTDLQLEVQTLCEKGACYHGRITFLDGQVGAKTGLLFARGEIPNEAKKLVPGQYVTIKIPISVAPKVMMIPQKAVKYNQQGPYVYTVSEDKRVEFRQLILGRDENENVVVIEGLASSERVITSSHGRLSPGIKVDVQP